LAATNFCSTTKRATTTDAAKDQKLLFRELPIMGLIRFVVLLLSTCREGQQQKTTTRSVQKPSCQNKEEEPVHSVQQLFRYGE
jgi:hypothetical protein